MITKDTPGEAAHIHKAVIDAFRSHWKAHNNKYPQKLIMNSQQERAFRCFHNSHNPPGMYFGVPIEIAPTSPGVMIALDGTVMPFADYDPSGRQQSE